LVDLCECQLLAQLVALTTVARDIDRLRVEERFVQPVELLLDRLHPPLLLCCRVCRLGSLLFTQVEDSVLDQSHVARRRLQQCDLVNKRALELDLGHVDRAALAWQW
jgi:hypothetical protein